MRRLQQQLEEMEIRVRDSNNRAINLERRVSELNSRLDESDGRVEESDQRVHESAWMIGQLQQELAGVRQNLQEHRRDAQLAREQQTQCEQHLQEHTREVQLTRQQLRECEQRLDAASNNSHWVMRREEIEMTGPELGRGGWATVSVATFRGVQVALKTIHRQIISPHNIQLFRCEMNMAARLRHPNLLELLAKGTW